ncbi:1-phosphatidylinositol 4,5-bisphosphate phosphodiesterase classes I and II-like isoform X3 [Tachypleus tridentatus]|uniref:1-phosphatidylinositol 4,5-bisphosphate phosphodiesterase classes I and II-like isoform X3 n=1 Tax=Tachypleus tridentatus TaxID=6853 RepID=UPI003FD4AFB8
MHEVTSAQIKETEHLEISTIRDIRTGKYARLPKKSSRKEVGRALWFDYWTGPNFGPSLPVYDAKLRDVVNMGPRDVPLEEKALTVVYGADLANINFCNFCCNSRETTLIWAKELLKMAYNLMSWNASSRRYLEKAHTKLTLMRDRSGKIPVKNIVRMFATHKDDKRRVEKALELAGLPKAKNDSIAPEKFTFEDFFCFYRHLSGRMEVYKLYEKLCGGNKKKGMTTDQLVNFLNKEQRDPRLNEILYPYLTPEYARDVIRQCEPNKAYAQKDLLSAEGFLQYLMSEDNSIMALDKLDLNEDMNQPLNHYFINSSHNTYLTGHQLTGKSSVEMYRQCLLAGCRCIELDCWNGHNSDEEPIITHGYTVVTEILLKEVIEAIAESAFKTSEYPVILSFENHCSPKQQAKMAMYCQKAFGEMLLTEPLSTHPLKPGHPLPSPKQLLRKILIKNKRKRYPLEQKSGNDVPHEEEEELSFHPSPEHILPVQYDDLGNLDHDITGIIHQENNEKMVSLMNSSVERTESNSSRIESFHCMREDSILDSGGEDDENPYQQTEEGTKESEAGAEMSALVNYIQPVHFHSFEHAERRNRCNEVSSFVETQATNLLKEHPVEFVNYNKRQLSRIYPRGTRVDSSNYMPQVFWNAGCQMVALNFQTFDLGMQLNQGIFEYNAHCGYLLKPEFMRRADRKFDPFIESTVDGIIAGTVTVQIISGQFLSDRKVGTYVEVDMYGLPADTVRRRFRTKTVPGNGINPTFDEEPFVFKKVVLPELACLRITVNEENGRFIGHRVLPVIGLRPGYRHISLRNESGQPLTLPSLFVHVTVKDYIPDSLSELADALANPIAYQSMVEKHTKQLLALTDDVEMVEEDSNGIPSPAPCDIRKTEPDKTRAYTWKSDSEAAETKNILELNSKSVSINGNLPQCTGAFTSNLPSPVMSHFKLDFEIRTHEVVIFAEPIEQLKKHKGVQKIYSKLQRDLRAIQQKYEKRRQKERDSQEHRESKITTNQEKKRLRLTMSQFKLTKKSSACDIQKMKKKSEADLGKLSIQHETKLKEVERQHREVLIFLTKDQFRVEMEVCYEYHDPLYNAIEKAMNMSQNSQLQYLQTLHDREVSELMKKLEAQTRDEIRNLGKQHKEKNELSRIKRELQQKLIEQAVTERQRFSVSLEKKRALLQKEHEEVKRKLEEERKTAYERIEKEYEEKIAKCEEEYKLHSELSTLVSVANEWSEVTSL